VILPGVPHLFRKKFNAFKDRFCGDPIQSLHFYTGAEETLFAEDLSRIQASWPDVDIGSYPQKTESGWRAMLTLDSRNAEALSGCGADVERLVQRLESD
jgi:molybdopterin-biosynthesis enzyme MoeA-like protein